VKVLHTCISYLPSRSLAWASDRAGLGAELSPATNIYAGLDLAQPSPKIKNKKIKNKKI